MTAWKLQFGSLNSANPEVFRNEPVRPRLTANGTFVGRAEPAGLTLTGNRKRPDHNISLPGLGGSR